MARLDEFVADLARSRLVPRATVKQLCAELPPGPDDQAHLRLARLLIERELLTTYQLNKLLDGATKGFFVGPYRILRRLGEGGTGKVFLAVHEPTGNHVALKVLPPRKALEDAGAIELFERETELSQRVDHRHVASTLDVGVDDGVYYMALEFVPGETLYSLVRSHRGGPLPVPEAARLFLQALDGLDAAHRAGLVHRDIKPSNLMVTPEGVLKLLDLGLAHAPGEERGGSDPELVIGTLDYASPEQIDDAEAVDARSDLYSLGCTLYFALTGVAPFEGGDAINKIYKHRLVEPTPVERRNRSVPPAFGAIVARLMAKDPAARYPSARAARAELAPWADWSPPAGVPASSDGPAPRTRPRDRPGPNESPPRREPEPGGPPPAWLEDSDTGIDPAPAPTGPPSARHTFQHPDQTAWLRPVLIMAGVLLVLLVLLILARR